MDCVHRNTKWNGNPFMDMAWYYRDNKHLDLRVGALSCDLSVSERECLDCGYIVWIASGKFPHPDRSSFVIRREPSKFLLSEIIYMAINRERIASK